MQAAAELVWTFSKAVKQKSSSLLMLPGELLLVLVVEGLHHISVLSVLSVRSDNFQNCTSESLVAVPAYHACIWPAISVMSQLFGLRVLHWR